MRHQFLPISQLFKPCPPSVLTSGLTGGCCLLWESGDSGGEGEGMEEGWAAAWNINFLSLWICLVLLSPRFSFRWIDAVDWSHHGGGVSRPTPRDRQGTHRAAISGQTPAEARDDVFSSSNLPHFALWSHETLSLKWPSTIGCTVSDFAYQNLSKITTEKSSL